ncbi:MAG TPA: hypothetical protein DEW46_18470 [Verrucomicrobia bacterium]|nr:hypothetical protein [Verrucomicrobiota bacterium]
MELRKHFRQHIGPTWLRLWGAALALVSASLVSAPVSASPASNCNSRDGVFISGVDVGPCANQFQEGVAPENHWREAGTQLVAVRNFDGSHVEQRQECWPLKAEGAAGYSYAGDGGVCLRVTPSGRYVWDDGPSTPEVFGSTFSIALIVE